MPEPKFTERLTHHVSDPDALEESMREGTPVTSDCGKVWVPSRDPDHFDFCPTCVAATMRRGWMA